MPASRPRTMLLQGHRPRSRAATTAAKPIPRRCAKRRWRPRKPPAPLPASPTAKAAAPAPAARVFALATSHGFCRRLWRKRLQPVGERASPGEGAAMQRDYGQHSARHLPTSTAPATIGTRAGERAVARLNPGKAPSGTMPVLFDPRVGGSLIGHLLGAIAGPAIARGTSFLLGKRRRRLFDSGIVIRDDPHRPRGLRSRAVRRRGPAHGGDAISSRTAGLPAGCSTRASARQLGLKPTGHARAAAAARRGSAPATCISRPAMSRRRR